MPGPLAGIVVVDITQGLAGPYCSMLLSDAGAEVIKVEPPSGDTARGYGPAYRGEDAAPFVELNRNKRSMALDIERPEGMDALRRLIATADVLLTDLSPARAADLHLDYPSVEAISTRVVQCNITPFGERGPMANQPGAEIVIQAMAEYTESLGTMGEPPVRLGTDVGNINTGGQAVQGIVAALFMRERTGEGQLVTVNMLGTLMHLRGMMWASHSEGVDDWWGFHQDTYIKPADHGYETKDGYVFLTAGQGTLSPESLRALTDKIGIDPKVYEDPRWAGNGAGVIGGSSRYGYEVKPVWNEALRKFTTQEVIALFDEAGANAFPVNNYATLFADPQVQEIQMLRELPDATLGSYRTLGSPWLFKQTPAGPHAAAPGLGEHTDEVLTQAGFSAADIAKLKEAGAAR